jgi:hypothetical protein
MAKTWKQKFETRTEPQKEILTKPFGGGKPGDTMLIATPAMVREFIEAIPQGCVKTLPQMRAEFSQRAGADICCPLTAGIFARIVAELALEELAGGRPLQQITPFWRLVDPKSPLAKKLSCGPDFITERRAAEAC